MLTGASALTENQNREVSIIPLDRAVDFSMKSGFGRSLPEGSVNLWGAEMDIKTAPCIREALSKLAGEGLYGFTLPTEEYRQRIAWWISQRDAADSSWVVPTLGTVFAFSTAVRAFTKEGDGIVVLSPSYSRFDRAIERNKRRVLTCPLQEAAGLYSLDLNALEAVFKQEPVSLMVLVNPHNPTGKVFSWEELEPLAELTKRYGVRVFCDEIFAETAQAGHTVPLYTALDRRSISCASLGKAFNLTGVNAANVLIQDPETREKFTKQRDQDHYGSIDPFFYAALMAGYSEEGMAWIQQVNQMVLENYRLLEQAFREEMPDLSLSPMEGTYVGWVDGRQLSHRYGAVQEFFEKEALVFGDPGEDYGPGGEGFYRINLATPKKKIEQAIQQLKKAYQSA